MAGSEKPSFLWEGPPALVVVGGQGLTIGSRLNLKPGRSVLGRTPESDIAVPDGSISRRHAELSMTASADVAVVDLGSRHGTFVNDRAVEGLLELHDGDYLRCGSVVFKFRSAGAPEKNAAANPARPAAPRPAARREETTARGGSKPATKPASAPTGEPTVPAPGKKR